MRYVIDIPQNQASAIEETIREGKYKNFAQFIITALENQIYIENSEIERDQSIEAHHKRDIVSLEQEHPRRTDNENNLGLRKIDNQKQVVSTPTFETLVSFVDGLEENRSWLWGQINRILPIKIGLRVLHNELGDEQWIELEEYRERAAEFAAELGTTIKKYEKKKGKLRDQKITAGLPDIRGYKSQVRYKGQFLAYMRKDGKLDGAMAHLKFVNLNKGEKGKVLIGMTEPGLQFAQLENPVLDNQNYEASLSEHEINFYLSHVSNNVKCESNAIKWLLSKISRGVNNREAINEQLKNEFGPTWKSSDSVINTQRAGLMARMTELGVVDKEKEGITVKYIITEKGRRYIA